MIYKSTIPAIRPASKAIQMHDTQNEEKEEGETVPLTKSAVLDRVDVRRR